MKNNLSVPSLYMVIVIYVLIAMLSLAIISSTPIRGHKRENGIVLTILSIEAAIIFIGGAIVLPK
jgi:hypothetical protein